MKRRRRKRRRRKRRRNRRSSSSSDDDDDDDDLTTGAPCNKIHSYSRARTGNLLLTGHAILNSTKIHSLS
jgi:hypothetical protein